MAGNARGSQKGLKQNREDTKRQNTDAMWRVIQSLRKNKSDKTWTYKEVWAGAGLKSNVALKSPWNQHIRDAIDQHNQEIRESADLGPVGQSQRKTLREAIKQLRKELEQMKAQRDEALNQVAVWEAESTYYKDELAKKDKQIARLREQAKALDQSKK